MASRDKHNKKIEEGYEEAGRGLPKPERKFLESKELYGSRKSGYYERLRHDRQDLSADLRRKARQAAADTSDSEPTFTHYSPLTGLEKFAITVGLLVAALLIFGTVRFVGRCIYDIKQSEFVRSLDLDGEIQKKEDEKLAKKNSDLQKYWTLERIWDAQSGTIVYVGITNNDANAWHLVQDNRKVVIKPREGPIAVFGRLEVSQESGSEMRRVIVKDSLSPIVEPRVYRFAVPRPVTDRNFSNPVRSTDPIVNPKIDPANARATLQSDKIYPQPRMRLLVEQDVESLSYAQLRYAINEIYARHGLFFRDPDLRRHFSQFAWYVPNQQKSLEEIEREFSANEVNNTKLLGAARDRKKP